MVPVMTSLNLATGIFAEVTEATTQSTLVHQTGDEWSGSGYWIWRPETEEVLKEGGSPPKDRRCHVAGNSVAPLTTSEETGTSVLWLLEMEFGQGPE